MRFSVIIPCHNAGPWIGRTLASVARQTYAPHEIIVVDDDSTDDSVARVRESRLDIKLLSTKQGNAAGSRNVGIEAAGGDWIALLDADDLWYPNHLERAAAMLGPTKDVAFMAANEWIDLDDKKLPMPDTLFHTPRASGSGLSGNTFIQMVRDGFHFGHSTVCYRRDRLFKVGMFDVSQRRRHDMDLWMRMIRGHTWSYDTEIQMGYRLTTPNSISKEQVNAEYFYLRSLVRNQEGFDVPEMRQIIDISARRAMGLALGDGTVADLREAKPLAWPYLKPSFRMFYRIAGIWPAGFQKLLRLKRRAQGLRPTVS
jgi:glycosyltransferase involved in cell wall biosynthesis